MPLHGMRVPGGVASSIYRQSPHEYGKVVSPIHRPPLTLNLLTTTIVAPPSNASKWQMGFNSAFKGLTPMKYYWYPYLLEFESTPGQ